MLEIILHEIKFLKKNPEIFLILMFASTGYAFLIGNLYSGRILQKIPVAVCDLDETNLSREFIKNISEADQFILEKNLLSEEESVKILERGEVSEVFIVPKDFTKKFYNQESTELVIFFDGANTVSVNYSMTSLNLLVGNFFAKYNFESNIKNNSPQISINPINLSLRTIGNTVNGYLEFYIYGVILMAAQVGISLAFGFSIFDDKKNLTPSKIIFKEIFYLTLSLISVIFGIIFLSSVYEMKFIGEIWKMILICGIFLFVMENFAGIFGIIFKKSLSVVQAIIFYTLPGLLTAGYIFPETGMTNAMKIFSKIQPVHYALSDFRKISLTGFDEEFFLHCGILICFGIFALILNLLLSKRILKKLLPDI